MADIRIVDLPLATGPTAPAGTDAVALDGLTTRKSTLSAIADAIRPMSSQAEAEAGVNAVKGMSPLTTKQAILAQGATAFASAAEGDLATSAMQPSTYDPASKGVNVYAQSFRDDSPRYYGAVGDGTTNDATSYTAAETAKTAVFIPDGNSFNIGSNFPAKPLFGPGTLRFGGQNYTGAQVTYNPYTTEVAFIPDSYYRKTNSFPAGSRHLNVIFSPAGPLSSANINRTTVLGNANALNAISLNRVELFGDGAGRLMRYGERNTLLGSISGEQLGAPDTSQNNFWIDAGGFVPGDASWNYQGLATKNPTIGSTIAAWAATNPFATVATDVRAMVGLGRDTFNGSLVGQNSTAIGYQASASNLNPQGMTTIGTQANQYGIFTSNSFAGGYLAAVDWQEGTRGTALGYQSAASLVRGSQWTAIGAFAASDYTDLNDSIALGYGAANGLGLTQGNGLLAIGLSGNPLIGGNLKSSGGTYTGPNAGINISPANIKGTFHVRSGDFGTSENANANAATAIFEASGAGGITIRSGSTSLGAMVFARSGQSTRGGFIYNHSTDVLTARAASADRLQITGTGIGFNGTAAIAKPTVTGAKASNAALASLLTQLASYGLITDSTTA